MEIARAFLSTEPTIAQRIVRAKRTLADAHVAFDLPRGPELGERLSSVLEVVYLVFNEGYSATAGDDILRRDLCAEAIRLGELLVEVAPTEPEAGVLEARKSLKKVRAILRLTRKPLGKRRFRDENRRYRDLARQLSAQRAGVVRVKALDQLA